MLFLFNLGHFQSDWLSVYFAFIIILIFIPVSIYTIGYINEYKKLYSSKYMIILMTLFVASMLGVILSDNGITFLVFWELMSIFSFLLVIYEYLRKENLKSGILYFVMTHISGLFLMFMFAFLFKYTGSFNFKVILNASKQFSSQQKNIIFVLALLGFGAKAGIIPLHTWLPKAHPAAPSNVSALMSGVMLKVALYGFIRVVFILLGFTPLNCGIIVMVIGTGTAIFSIINAMVQNDIKELLAYSSSENIGLIFATLGISMILRNYGIETIASLALTAALFHILNHAIFKSLLFLNAGSVLYATGSKNMNELGGLYKNMKSVAICTFIGTCAISAIPPLNGFASEILILRSYIEGGAIIDNIVIKILIISCGIILALTSGGTLYASVKCFGITFLGKARSKKAEYTKTIPISMNIGQAVLATFAVICGVFSPFIINMISNYTFKVFYSSTKNVNYKNETDILIFSLVLIIITYLLYLYRKVNLSTKKQDTNDTWGCGYNRDKPYIQYTGSGYVQPAAKIFGAVANYHKEIRKKESIYIRQSTKDVIEKYLYLPILKVVDNITVKILKLHYGKIQLYISYIFLSLIFALILILKFV